MVKPATDLDPGFKMTELGPLPEEWEVVKLGDTCEKPEYGYTASATKEPVGPKFLRITDIQEGQVKWETVPYCKCSVEDLRKYGLRPKDLLFARIGATTGKSYLIRKIDNAIFASYLIRVRTKDSLDADYLAYFADFSIYWNQINASKGGRLKGGVNIPILRNILLPLPSLPEQRAIARVLRAVQRAREATEAVIETAQKLKRSLMRHLFTYGPVPVDQVEQVKLKDTEIGPVPEEWEEANLGDVVQGKSGLKRGPWGGSIKKEIFVDHGYKIYEQQNAIHADFNLGHYYIDEEKFQGLEGFVIKAGDLIMSAAGTIGKVAIVPQNIEEGIINQALIRIRANEARILTNYLKILLEYYTDGGKFVNLSHGATLKNLASTRVLKTLPIGLPPLPEQRKIAEILSTVDRKIETEQARKTALDNLFATLLANLMTGKIRVKVKKKIKQKE